MPYFVTEKGQHPDCKGFGVVKEDGELVGCHTTKQSAVDQMVAVSLAEELEPGGTYTGQHRNTQEPICQDCTGDCQVCETRAGTGPTVIISDIDGILISGGRRSEKVWQYIQDQEGSLYLITGRPDSTRSATEATLKSLDITYSRLIMNDGSAASSNDFKKRAAEELLKSHTVNVAIENNPLARRRYSSLGIQAINPATLPSARARIETDKEGKTLSDIEQRMTVKDFEVREDANGMTLTGYAARFNEPSEPLPFIERIAPGAFKRSLRSRNDIKLLWNHDTSSVLGSTRSGTLRLSEDAQGLRVDATLPDTQAGRDAKVLIQRGDVTGFSFGFTVPSGGDSWSSDGSERTLKSVRLLEVSTGVAFPAYTSTNGTAQVRGLDKVALRAEVDAEALADALIKIEDGQDISTDEAELLSRVITKLAPEPMTEEETKPVGDMGMLALKKKKLELLLKGI